MPSAGLSEQRVEMIDTLESGEMLEHKVTQLVEHELRRRLVCDQLIARLLREK